MPIKLPLTRRAHILISANHRMERFSKNDSCVIFNKITGSSMTLAEGNHHSCCKCLANERYFHIKSFSGERFSAIYISLTGLNLFNPSAGFVIPKRDWIFPITGFSFPKWSSFNTEGIFLSPNGSKWRSLRLICILFAGGRKILHWSSTLKHLSKPFIRPDWNILRKLWHTEKIRHKKLKGNFRPIKTDRQTDMLYLGSYTKKVHWLQFQIAKNYKWQVIIWLI